jgi:hypothetical protein
MVNGTAPAGKRFQDAPHPHPHRTRAQGARGPRREVQGRDLGQRGVETVRQGLAVDGELVYMASQPI